MMNFKKWLQEEDVSEGALQNLALAGMLGLSSVGNTAAAANSSEVVPQDSIGQQPQIKVWKDSTGSIEKQGHLEKIDNDLITIRLLNNDSFTMPINWFSEEDKIYIDKHRGMKNIDINAKVKDFIPDVKNIQQAPNQQSASQNSKPYLSTSDVEFDPTFGPKPPNKNPTPMQVYKYQINLVNKAQMEINRGKRPSAEWLILYKKYNGQQPFPPTENE